MKGVVLFFIELQVKLDTAMGMLLASIHEEGKLDAKWIGAWEDEVGGGGRAFCLRLGENATVRRKK